MSFLYGYSELLLFCLWQLCSISNSLSLTIQLFHPIIRLPKQWTIIWDVRFIPSKCDDILICVNDLISNGRRLRCLWRFWWLDIAFLTRFHIKEVLHEACWLPGARWVDFLLYSAWNTDDFCISWLYSAGSLACFACLCFILGGGFADPGLYPRLWVSAIFHSVAETSFYMLFPFQHLRPSKTHPLSISSPIASTNSSLSYWGTKLSISYSLLSSDSSSEGVFLLISPSDWSSPWCRSARIASPLDISLDGSGPIRGVGGGLEASDYPGRLSDMHHSHKPSGLL